jgi:hypothetical protein
LNESRGNIIPRLKLSRADVSWAVTRQWGKVVGDEIRVYGVLCIQINVEEEIEYPVWGHSADIPDSNTVVLVLYGKISRRPGNVQRKSATLS